ncbi:MAG: WecB/TagA/CpsF family glycosyltransferase [Brevundimonas sp.]|uniref:WecB/TagA/CpsF family glycosyltransferase n=1 Tax=Brevundimonas sp. TaxID=1871086 RepID=UPI0027736ECE|nr:WecB/TagA/CpsF family glycosyltransferase [Brevundimonas sp.]MDP3399547.1 WecB/TagA/CpsF family glycosyltransferase [Brevundimonas sp.]MDZ4108500.1 WecB/TagA/CpsF family glycosyltransferase [Brevundimonas sp.]
MFDQHLALSNVVAAPDRRRSSRRPHRLQRRSGERIRLLGQVMDKVRPEEVMHQLETWVEAGVKAVIANHNLHSLHLIRTQPRLAEFFARADLVQIDSTPLIAFGRLVGRGTRRKHRSTYLDWREHFWSLADRKGWRVMFIGGAEGVADAAAERLRARHGRVDLSVRSGYFDATPGSEDNRRLVAEVAEFAPQVLLVGMGMPRQEIWIADHLDALPDCVVLNVGAAFDYEAGVQKAAPRWMGQMGLEWLYRLAVDPRRLFHRYCVEPWHLIGPITDDLKAALKR